MIQNGGIKMTKTLTEQWREGTLPRGAYYVNRLNEFRIYLVTYEDDKNTHEIYEVLAPVPSYNKFKEMSQKIESLEQKLNIAIDALDYYANSFIGGGSNKVLLSDGHTLCYNPEIAKDALKGIRGE